MVIDIFDVLSQLGNMEKLWGATMWELFLQGSQSLLNRPVPQEEQVVRINMCKRFDTWNMVLITTNLPHSSTQGRSRHAEVESEVKS